MMLQGIKDCMTTNKPFSGPETMLLLLEVILNKLLSLVNLQEPLLLVYLWLIIIPVDCSREQFYNQALQLCLTSSSIEWKILLRDLSMPWTVLQLRLKVTVMMIWIHQSHQRQMQRPLKKLWLRIEKTFKDLPKDETKNYPVLWRSPLKKWLLVKRSWWRLPFLLLLLHSRSSFLWWQQMPLKLNPDPNSITTAWITFRMSWLAVTQMRDQLSFTWRSQRYSNKRKFS